jgi:MFS family permease
VFVTLLAVAAFLIQLGMGIYFVLIRELASAGTEGTSLTILSAFSFSGSFVAPIVGGWLITTYSWTVAFVAFTVLGFLGVVAVLTVPEPAR